MNREDRFRKAEQGELFPTAILEEQNREDPYKSPTKNWTFWVVVVLALVFLVPLYFI